MLHKIFTLSTKIKTTIITICALSYNLTAQASPSDRPRDRVNKTMIELQTNGVERQLLDNSCGISSLSYILNKYFKKNTSEKNIFLLIGLKPDYSLLDLASTSRTLGISTIGLKLSINDLKKVSAPTILKTKTNGGHFVVYSGYRNGWFQVIDPAKGKLNYYEHELSKIFIQPNKDYGMALIFLSKNKNRFVDDTLYNNNTNRLFLERHQIISPVNISF
ncbi:hypothetical protein GKD88_19365 [Holdemania massiliensis]|uniref:Peptidase C39 domain-containing protein n=1 Tax=Holdemania massiliensis TaxID=1468449 RepID=A0ABW9QNG2_9FIRM|nr:cysteine peptidase family C39 domain-containing protein [Holdemania massiliensis]MSC35272.1 hypothetical protein [Holdemania massiliensis]